MMDCNHCQEVNLKSLIGSPKQFEKVLRVIRANLADGIIVESIYWPKGKMKTCNTPFNEVNGLGPYQEDIFLYYFECPKCHQVYELHCNTYHGSGGAWKPLDEKCL